MTAPIDAPEETPAEEPVAPLRIKRQKGHMLTVSKTDKRYDVRVSGGPNITADELAEIEAYIGDDPDGASTLEKLRARVSA